MFKIGGFQKTTLIDYPEKIAALIFTQGCNFRCGYCHNPELINCHSELVSESDTKDKIIDFLKTRKGKLDGIVITGGEPTLQSGLYNFMKQVKNLGFSLKLDTNGSNPDIIEKLISDKLVDYIAMDIKAPLEKYETVSNVKLNIDKIKKSIDLIMESNIEYEFRTTVLKSQLCYNDFEKIGKLIQGAKKYYLQKFVKTKILDTRLMNEITYTDKEFELICNKLKQNIQIVEFR